MNIDIHGRMAKYRWLIAGSHYVTWRLGQWFPDAIPLTYVLGYPKSGTTWVTQLMADVLQLPFPRLSILPIGCPAVVHGHEVLAPRHRRCVYVVRDGRDVMVSLYFHLSQSIPEGDSPRLTSNQRKMFPGLKNKADAASNLPAFIETQMKRPKSSFGLNWGQHVERFFLEGRSDVPLIRYEELLLDPVSVVFSASKTLTGDEFSETRIRASVEKFSFQSQSKRTSGLEDRKSFLRKGQSGDWRNYFTRDACDVFEHYCGNALRAAGYESSTDWTALKAA